MSEEQGHEQAQAGGIGDTLGQAMQAPEAPEGEVPKDHKTMGMLCHLLAFCGLLGVPAGNFLGPLVLWLVKKEQMPFVDDQGKESLNFQITTLIVLVPLGLASIIPFVFCITVPLIIGLGIVWLVFVIIAALKANEGVHYRYPFNIRFIK